ncbi:MAG: type II secretion system protein [Candidatus Saccharimonadales bacterium]|nr:type II secretion system protein [Candidatus Saccharimonadales bacterium]
MLKNIRKNDSGFTIVELLIVIVVIGILAALVLNTFSGIQERARDTERRTDINSLSTQLEVYYADNGGYPDGSTAGFEITTTNLPGMDDEARYDPNGNLVNLASDPDSATDNQYHYNPTGCTAGLCTTFELGTVLEQDSSVYKKNSLN